MAVVLALPITALRIGGKSIRALEYEERAVAPLLAWVVDGVLPVGATIAVTWWLAREEKGGGQRFARRAMWFAT